jgi:hypothetical protein
MTGIHGMDLNDGCANRDAEKCMSRNMSRYPIVLKDYGFPSYFARRFRYNEQALVYSGLLADRRIPAALAGENAAVQPEDRP